ncbi:helix-turn-helix domain-containing protein [Lacticaseibacillus brantae]|uniref:XRE family transcriptional regulator n=1 Tax=Lacticaseibacillus brantae DSM 23927 TaxID=1423727 RepID=A0A0R2AY87_9LACO|nr:helix-turn-helix domain-containing protein [Lacticaseibacillus brantae]KRM72333.1 XRE family transcriptional regulator [Lacticaseibacillus brantae DSM 23927]
MDEIGQKLQAARVEKGYTLDDLQQVTKIQKRYLIAIEEGRFDALPGDFYVRAFIKQYAQTVGLDGDALLNEFQEDVPVAQPTVESDQNVDSRTRTNRTPSASPANRIRRYLPQILIAVIGLAIILVIYIVTMRQTASEPKPAIPIESSVKVSDKSSSSERADSSSKTSESSKKKASESSSKKADKKDLSVDVTPADGATQAVAVKNLPKTGNKITVGVSSGQAWVSVMINGATTWQGLLQAGTNQAVDLPDGTTAFSVKSGNAPVTTIQVNDSKVDLGNAASIVRTINFTATTAE